MKPSRTKMMRELEAAGWRRWQSRPKEPTYWIDPLGLILEKERTEMAYAILEKRRANGIGR